MGDPLGAASSIIGVVAFGLKFATTLQTYIEAVSDARESLRDIAFDVSATASALDQLHHFIQADENGKVIANDSGVQEVARLASKCRQVYTAVIDLIAKAVGAPRDDDGEVLIDALDAIDLNESNARRLVQKLKWPFQEPRIKRHQEELRWLKISLLFHVQLMELAKTKIMAATKSFSVHEREMAQQANLEKLLISKQSYARRIASERRRHKKKVRGKAVLAKTRSSSSDGIFESRSPSPKTKGKRPLSKSPPRNNIRELAPPSMNGNGNFGIQNTEPPMELHGGVLEYLPANKTPKPPKSKSKSPTPDPIIFNQLLAETMPDNTQTVGNNKVPGKDGGLPNATRPVPISTSPHLAKRTQNGTYVLTMTTASSQPGAQNVPSTKTNGDKGKANPHNHAIRHLSDQHKPKPPRKSFKFLPWPPNVFGKRNQNKSMNRHQSEDLEAYLIEGDHSNSKSNPIRKLPFSHEQLNSMLKQMAKSQKGDVWTQYTSLTSRQREDIDRALLEAHQISSHARTCVAISSGAPESSHIVVFFSLGTPAEPIHFKYNSRHFQFAFEMCRTWEGMVSLMEAAINDMRDPKGFLLRGKFDLKDANDRIILPSTWSSTVQPGITVSLIPLQSGISRPSAESRQIALMRAEYGEVSDQESTASWFRRGPPVPEETMEVPRIRHRDSDGVVEIIPVRGRQAPLTPSDVDSNIASASAPITSVRDWYSGSRAAAPRSQRGDRTQTEERLESGWPPISDDEIVDHIKPQIPSEGEDLDSDEEIISNSKGASGSETHSRPIVWETSRELKPLLLVERASRGSIGSSGSIETDIIDFEEEEETAGQRLEELLRKFTNTYKTEERQRQHSK